MPEQFLHGADVVAGFKQVRGERMPKSGLASIAVGMGRDLDDWGD
jgi:hypothetical protein